ncbi:WYL domain-containing protein [Desulfosudis oleivorans]|uniref:WYL domain-containing protein n=1 Tax=Desulfosudis oleivorans TaxID=181663 RepID=UPI0000ED8C88|nr:WYL domain-containing protein [Desulfosudis oleivorans]
MRWGVRQRLEFIETRLFWEGRINRGDLTEFFGISVPQASADIGLYQEKAKGNIEYDKNKKFYFASANFKPVFIEPNADLLFSQLRLSECGLKSDTLSFLGKIPECYIVPTPDRYVEIDVVRDLLKAIKNNLELYVEYQSMKSTDVSLRWLSPHSFAYDSYRWHVRAFCHKRNEYRDFVIGRLIKVLETRRPQKALPEDKKWNTTVVLKIGPHPGLQPHQKSVIERDYKMTDGILEVRVKEAMLFYAKKRLGFDDKNHAERPSNEQQIVLLGEEKDDGPSECGSS